jgi:hypothetical protein
MDGLTTTTPFLEFRLWWRRLSPGSRRPVTYHTSCGCWQTDNPNFQPSF